MDFKGKLYAESHESDGNIKIRKADYIIRGDYDFIYEGYIAVDSMHENYLGTEEFKRYYGDFYMTHDELKKDIENDLINSKDDIYLIAEIEGVHAGFIHLKFDISVENKYAVAKIRVLYADIRRQGVASTLMRVAEELAKKKKFSTLVLRVFRFNIDAISLYKKLGYKEVHSGADEHSFLMQKNLK